MSKTKQGRLTVTMECYIEVGIADAVVAFRSSPDEPWGDILVSNKKYIQI